MKHSSQLVNEAMQKLCKNDPTTLEKWGEQHRFEAMFDMKIEHQRAEIAKEIKEIRSRRSILPSYNINGC